MREIRGVTYRYYAQGMASVAWAVQEDGFVRPDGSWMFEGLHFLEAGDDLTIYDSNGVVLWSGILPPQPKSSQMLPWFPEGIDRRFWWDLFGERRCLVRRHRSKV